MGQTPPGNESVADRAKAAPISKVHYEVEEVHFKRRACEFNDTRLPMSGTSDQRVFCREVVTVRAHCPGSPLKVIGGGARVSDRLAGAAVIDSYPDETGVDAKSGAWVAHIERRVRRVDEGSGADAFRLPEIRVRVTAICAEVDKSERDD